MAVSRSGVHNLQQIIVSWIRVITFVLTFSVPVNSNGRCGCAQNRLVGNGKCLVVVVSIGLTARVEMLFL